MGELRVRKMVEGDIPLLAERMARAFHPQPLTRWLFGKGGTMQRETRLLAIELRRALPYDLSYTTEDLRGAAIWFPPVRKTNLRSDSIAAVQAGMAIGVGLRSIAQAWMALQLLMAEPREKNYYLSLLAVAPEWQSQGAGSALLQPVLRRCDEERMPASLSTDTEENVRFYRHHGFRVRKRFSIPGASFRMTVMVRP